MSESKRNTMGCTTAELLALELVHTAVLSCSYSDEHKELHGRAEKTWEIGGGVKSTVSRRVCSREKASISSPFHRKTLQFTLKGP